MKIGVVRGAEDLTGILVPDHDDVFVDAIAVDVIAAPDLEEFDLPLAEGCELVFQALPFLDGVFGLLVDEVHHDRLDGRLVVVWQEGTFTLGPSLELAFRQVELVGHPWSPADLVWINGGGVAGDPEVLEGDMLDLGLEVDFGLADDLAEIVVISDRLRHVVDGIFVDAGSQNAEIEDGFGVGLTHLDVVAFNEGEELLEGLGGVGEVGMTGDDAPEVVRDVERLHQVGVDGFKMDSGEREVDVGGSNEGRVGDAVALDSGSVLNEEVDPLAFKFETVAHGIPKFGIEPAFEVFLAAPSPLDLFNRHYGFLVSLMVFWSHSNRTSAPG